jgi:hypothetical protein
MVSTDDGKKSESLIRNSDVGGYLSKNTHRADKKLLIFLPILLKSLSWNIFYTIFSTGSIAFLNRMNSSLQADLF